MSFKPPFIIVFILLLTSLVSCKRKLFAKVEIKGRLVDYFTNQPVRSVVSLGGDDHNEKNAQPAISLETVQTDSDGNFVIKTKAMKTGEYYLSFKSPFPNRLTGFVDNVGKIDKFSVKERTTKDFGTFYGTTHTFYCKINLNYASGMQNNIYIDFTASKLLYFPYGTSTQATTLVEYSQEAYESHNHNFEFTYLLQGPSFSQRHLVSIPIQSSDTVYTTINY